MEIIKMGGRTEIINELLKKMNDNEVAYKNMRQAIEQEAKQKLNISLTTLNCINLHKRKNNNYLQAGN